jgi:bifunctional NMN adenylyltransferase/nudix hydrolase
MKPKTVSGDVGVIVGRFQVPNLHEAHIDLIQTVCDAHAKVIIFLGLSPCKVTLNNPLDFECRKQMILEKFPNVNVLYIKDVPSDEDWSRRLDEQIRDVIGPNSKAILYGSRDSFIAHYKGKFTTQELEQDRFVSGTEIRKQVACKASNSPEFRAGVIWAVNNQYPKCHPTVDVAIIDEANRRLLLARKPNETLYRFVGGFADPRSTSYEQDVKREVTEETGLEVDDIQYLGSFIIDDWRYRSEQDKIKTLFFKARYIFGGPKPNDDISEVRWFDLDKVRTSDFVEEHRPLFLKLANETKVIFENGGEMFDNENK